VTTEEMTENKIKYNISYLQKKLFFSEQLFFLRFSHKQREKKVTTQVKYLV